MVRGPADAVMNLCTQDLTSSIAAELGVDSRSLPQEAVARVCFAPPEGHVMVIDGFLSPAEVAHMKKLVADSIHHAQDHSQPGYRCVHAAGIQYPAGLVDEASEGGARTERYRRDHVL